MGGVLDAVYVLIVVYRLGTLYGVAELDLVQDFLKDADAFERGEDTKLLVELNSRFEVQTLKA